MSPLHTISIVTPNLNTAGFLGETMESVLQQHYPRLEYVISDGGSDDGSMAIVERHRDRLHGIIHGPDRGHADAINKGFALTSGDVMGWINSDDVLHGDALATIDAVFAAFPDIEWITGIPTTALGGGGAGTTRFKVHSGRTFTFGDFLAGDYKWLQQESTFWRRSLWERAGGRLDTRLQLAVDLDLWVRFSRHARLYTVEALLGAFRHRDGQRSVALLDKYLGEADSIIAREREALRTGQVTVDTEALRRSSVTRVRARLLGRLGHARQRCDISRAQVETARLARWVERITGEASHVGQD